MVQMIKETFFARFEKTLKKREPKSSEIEMVFTWLKHQAPCAREFEHLKMIDDLRMLAESRFAQVKHVQKKVDERSNDVNKEIKKRDDQLRTIITKKRGKLSFVEGAKEEEKVPPRE